MPPARFVAPMLPSAGDLPVGDDWAYDVKWDGWRAQVHVESGSVRVWSRNGADLTTRVPELAGLAIGCSRDVVVDGELVVLREGSPDFTATCRRLAGRSRAAVVTFVAFDLLSVDGASWCGRPWHERRSMLHEIVGDGAAWCVPPAFDDACAAEVVRAAGLEGVVAKRRSARYEPGRRTRAWVKVKNWEDDVVVACAYRTDERGIVDAVAIGVPDGQSWRRVGVVEVFAMGGAARADLRRRLAANRTGSASRGWQPVAPVVAGRVRHLGWVDGRVDRPVWDVTLAELSAVLAARS